MLMWDVPLGYLTWGKLSQDSSLLIFDLLGLPRTRHMYFGWLPEFLIGFLIFGLSRLLLGRLPRPGSPRSNSTVDTSARDARGSP